MNCQKCGSENLHVVDSRKGPDFVRRKRKCVGCGTVSITYEMSADARTPEPLPPDVADMVTRSIAALRRDMERLNKRYLAFEAEAVGIADSLRRDEAAE